MPIFGPWEQSPDFVNAEPIGPDRAVMNNIWAREGVESGLLAAEDWDPDLWQQTWDAAVNAPYTDEPIDVDYPFTANITGGPTAEFWRYQMRGPSMGLYQCSAYWDSFPPEPDLPPGAIGIEWEETVPAGEPAANQPLSTVVGLTVDGQWARPTPADTLSPYPWRDTTLGEVPGGPVLAPRYVHIRLHPELVWQAADPPGSSPPYDRVVSYDPRDDTSDPVLFATDAVTIFEDFDWNGSTEFRAQSTFSFDLTPYLYGAPNEGHASFYVGYSSLAEPPMPHLPTSRGHLTEWGPPFTGAVVTRTYTIRPPRHRFIYPGSPQQPSIQRVWYRGDRGRIGPSRSNQSSARVIGGHR